MSKLPLIEKYRPKTLDEIISQVNNIKILKQSLHHGQLPHMLFYGPAGSGKTSTILALAKDYYGEHYKEMILELNGSDDRGINIIRTQIKYFSKIKNLLIPDKPKIIILDEADSLTYDAQFALRRVMEKFTTNVRFCLICNYLNKLIPAIHSRCTLLRFSTIKSEDMYSKLLQIIEAEKLKIPKKKLEMIIELSMGDFRKNLNFIEQNKIDEFKYFLGVERETYKEIETMLKMSNKNYKDTKNKLENIFIKNKISFHELLKLISIIAFKLKLYKLISKLASLEYKFYLGTNLFESIYFDYLILILIQ
jgi:replication factor C subunit 3/5